MGDESMSVERGVVIGPEITQKVNPQEDVPKKPERVDLEAFYQNELTRYKTEQTRHYEKAWETIEKAAERNTYKSKPQEQEKETKPPSLTDKVHRQALLIQARIEGVKNLPRFQELVDYFESTVDERETKHINVPKGLTDEEKNKKLAEWKEKGWSGELDDFHEYQSGKHGSLTLKCDVPLRLDREHARFIKNLVSSENNPVEMAKELRKMGFWFSGGAT